MKFLALVSAMLLLAALAPPAIAAAPVSDLRIALTGNAFSADGGHQLGYAVTIFRYAPHEPGLTAEEQRRATVFIATCTLTDASTRHHATAQRFGRSDLDHVATRGYDADIDIGNWDMRSRIVDSIATIRVNVDDPHVHLHLESHGALPHDAPFIPPMRTTGRIDGMAIRGMSTVAIDSAPDLVGGTRPDRFIAVVDIRGARGVHTIRIVRLNDDDAQLQVTMIDPDGLITRFHPGEVNISHHGDNQWMSSDTAHTYLTTWDIGVPRLGIFISISPAVADQEFLTIPRDDSFWEGDVLVQPLDPFHQVYGEGIAMVSPSRR